MSGSSEPRVAVRLRMMANETDIPTLTTPIMYSSVPNPHPNPKPPAAASAGTPEFRNTTMGCEIVAHASTHGRKSIATTDCTNHRFSHSLCFAYFKGAAALPFKTPEISINKKAQKIPNDSIETLPLPSKDSVDQLRAAWILLAGLVSRMAPQQSMADSWALLGHLNGSYSRTGP